MARRHVLIVSVWASAAVVVAAAAQYVGTLDEHPVIQYAWRPATDPVTAVVRRQTQHQVTLGFDQTHGYLRAVLEALDVPVESQILTFAKGGIQGALTSFRTPRALYFNDSVVVGYVPGAPFLEVASHDPAQGVIFYTLNQDVRAPGGFIRRTGCITCHVSANSLEVPGLLVRSHFIAANGSSLLQLGAFDVDHRSPFDQRWGGWYVTGTHGTIRHLGNATVADVARPEAAVSDATLNVRSVADRFEAARYPSPHSDLVALMVFEHQARAINLLTRLGWETRIAQSSGAPDFARGELRRLVGELVDYLTFVDEPALTSPVLGTSGFAKRFASRGPRDAQGRSLRDLNLRTRLLEYPCSYMIGTPAFDGLPAAAREAVYRRLWEVLSGEDRDARYRGLTPARRRAAIEILRATRPGLPPYWG